MNKYVLLLVAMGLTACNQSSAPQQAKAVDTDAQVMSIEMVEVKAEQTVVPEKPAKVKAEHETEHAKVTTETTVAKAKVQPVAEAKKVVAPLVQGKQPLRSEPMTQPESVVMLGDAIKGKKVAKKCMSCHTFEQGGRQKSGPNLFAIMGGNKGSVAGFKYGTYLKNAGGVWTEADLRVWLKDSKAVAKGAGGKTKMSSQRIKGKKADDLIAYLKTLQ